MTFYDIEMSALGNLQRDEMAPDAKPGDAPIKTAPYQFVMVGQHPYTNHVIGYLLGDETAFEVDIGELGTKCLKLPKDFQQTCVNEILYGRTLTKATIIWSKYPIQEELRILRKMQTLQRTDEKVADSVALSAKESALSLKKEDLKSEFDDYTEWVEGIPDDE